MSDFSAIKATAFGILGLVLLASAAPDVAGGHLDPLRIGKKTIVRGGGGTVTPTPTPPPPPPPTSEPVLPQLSTIASNFDISSELVAASVPGSQDVEGAFRFICSAGQLLADDPIVYPGQPGKSHLHQYFGNTAANAHSTYQSLRTSGQSTCMSPLNRSAYWMPAMLDGRGNVVRPDFVSIYYKRRTSTDPKCSLSSGDPRAQGDCVALPNGLRFVFGHNMLNPADMPTGSAWFNCDGPGAVSDHYPDIVSAARYCPAGARLGAIIQAPTCWDGKNLDSPDHRSHVAYASYGDWGYVKCPSTHRYVIPAFTLAAWYTVDDSLDRTGTWEPGKTKTWTLSSDAMPGMTPMRPGTTFHSDWFGAWDSGVMAMWMDNCINKLLNCSAGDLGNGKRLKTFSGFSWTASPRLVPLQ